LKIEVDGASYELQYVIDSGGSARFDSEWNGYVDHGQWTIDKDNLPNEIKQYANEIEQVVNDNVTYGCCGGCL
jgi:hypothetical protein